MNSSNASFLWRNPDYADRFASGVCLHGHTMHSEECLSFLPRFLHLAPGVSQIVKHYQRGPQPAVDFSRAYWTPPLSPTSAVALETKQITGLGLRSLVSLTDHDNIEAGVNLQLMAAHGEIPISVEWTVPFRGSIFHIGIHNLPPASAQSWMSAMATYTATQDEYLLWEILSAYTTLREVLVVLNHPFWLEEGINEATHLRALAQILHEHAAWFHAFELNGTRAWKENQAVIELAEAHSRPIVSGGDRHACEPAACLNLTNARSFSEFAAEIRSGDSSVLFMPQYREPTTLRVTEAVSEILRRYPEYRGRERWIDRVFYREDDGVAKSLAALWENREPWMIRPLSGFLQFLATAPMRMALRLLMSLQTESLP